MNYNEILDLAEPVFLGVATTEKLETWKAVSKGEGLAVPELCISRILSICSGTPKLKELQRPRRLTHTKLKKKASKKKEELDLTAEDISNILETFEKIVRPKPEGAPNSPLSNEASKQALPVEKELISTFLQTTATAGNKSAISPPVLNNPCFSELKTILYSFLDKASKLADEGSSISLDCTEASNLLDFAQVTIKVAKIAQVDPVKHPAHPQVTAFKKLDCAKVERSGTLLNAEECLIIVNILAWQVQKFQEYKSGMESMKNEYQNLSVSGGIESLEV